MANVQSSARTLVLERWAEMSRAALIAAGGRDWIDVGSPDDRRIIVRTLREADPTSGEQPARARIERLVTHFVERDPVEGSVQEAWGRDIRGWLDKDHVATPDKIWRFLAVLNRNWLLGLADVGYLQHAAAMLDLLLADAQENRRLRPFILLTARVMFWGPLLSKSGVDPLQLLDERVLQIRLRQVLCAPDEESELGPYLRTVLETVRARLYGRSIPTRIDLQRIRSFELRAVARMVDFADFKSEVPADPFKWPADSIKVACAGLSESLLLRQGFPNVYNDNIAQKTMTEVENFIMRKRRGRSEGSLYQRSDGLWVASMRLGYSGSHAVRKTKYAKTKQDAQAKLLTMQQRALTGTEARASRVSFEEFADRWLQDYVRLQCRETTFALYASLLKNHVIPHIGSARLQRVSPEILQSLYSQLEKDGASPRLRQ